MKDSNKLIKSIYSYVWNYNYVHDNYDDYHTQLMDDTEEIAPIVKNYCESIIASKSETSKLVRDAVDNIYKYCRPENYMESFMNQRYPKHSDYIFEHPKSSAYSILEDINELIEATKSESDDLLQKLNDKWKHKWIYFNGDESGQQIIRINKIHYVNTKHQGYQLAYDGSMIKFLNENNSDEGSGVAVSEVENYLFENLYYIDYISSELYDYEENNDEKYSGKWSDPKKLDAALSSKPIDTDMVSRIISDDEVKEMINTQFFGEYGAIQKCCYDL